jgi:hypothetical protein
MKKLILIVLTLPFAFSCKQVNQTDDLISTLDSLKIVNDSLTLALIHDKPESNYWFDVEYDGVNLIDYGISNPVEFVENALRERTELIPLEAILGGTMHFGKIQLLSSEWLIAEFDDGHIWGRGIYKFSLNDQGELDFELLHSLGPE